MPHHGKEMTALTELMSSINFSPQELRCLRFQAEEGITRRNEKDERSVVRRMLDYMDHNTFYEGYDYRPEHEEVEELKLWVQKEMCALKKELQDAISKNGKRDEMGKEENDANDDDSESFFQHDPHLTKSEIDEEDGLKTWMRQELGQLRKELQSTVIEKERECIREQDIVAPGG